MRGLVIRAAVLGMVGLAGCVRSDKIDPSAACDGATTALIPRDRDAGPIVVVPTLPDGGSLESPDTGPSPPPDAASWGCFIDEDCSVFPELPLCDGFRCSSEQKTVACTQDTPHTFEGPEVTHTYVGSNGTYSDQCDAQGNLVDFDCEVVSRCSGSPNPACYDYYTGAVLTTPTVVDCVGQCHDGRCDGRCPQQGDHVTFGEATNDGSISIHNDTDGRSYLCKLTYDLATDTFDCSTVTGGQTAMVVSRSVGDNHCTGADYGGFGVAFPGISVGIANESCAYECGIDPTPHCN